MKILHTADIHLGSNAFGRIDPETGRNTRLRDFQRSFEFMVERGLREDIDLFLFCGDAYRTADPTPTQQSVFAACLRPLTERNIPVVMITGNHDLPVSFGRASSLDIFCHLQGDVRVYRTPQADVIQTTSGPLQLVAMPWPVRSLLLFGDDWRKKSPRQLGEAIEEQYAATIRELTARIDPELPTVLAGHFTVHGSVLAGSERPTLIAHEPKFTTAQLAVPPVDYVALGHIHSHQNCAASASGVPVVYSSSIERVSFRECRDRKGFVLVSIEGGPRKATYEFVETPARRLVDLVADLRQVPDPTESLLDRIRRENVAGAIVRVRYQVLEAQTSQMDMQRVRQALEPAFAIASIERQQEIEVRRQRRKVTWDSHLRDAMAAYIDQHDHLAQSQEALLEAALEVEVEYEASRRFGPQTGD